MSDDQQHSPYEPNRRNPDAALGIDVKMKIGWLALGFFLGVFAPLIIYFLYQRRDMEFRTAAMRYTIIGLAVGIAVQFVFLTVLNVMNPEAATISTSSSGWTSANF